MKPKVISGNIVDVVGNTISSGTITINNGVITSIAYDQQNRYDRYILPGFVDAHVHIESSMLKPSEFARLAVPHGTVATVSDPHEIGNILGIEGVRYMIENASQVPFHFFFGAPSCVPATTFETSGATIDAKGITTLLTEDKLSYLSEMMNFPGVVSRDPSVIEKIQIAKNLGLPVDGHAPGLRGKDLKEYVNAGISTDHESYTLDEALEKINLGMKILIREGSAAKNFNALHSLLDSHPEMVMLCSDDKHPNDLVRGHINELVKRAIVVHGYNVMDVLRAASYNPVKHYKLDVGLLQKGDPADFIVVDNLRDLNVIETYIKGELVASNGKSLIPSIKSETLNNFDTSKKSPKDFSIAANGSTLHVIRALDGELITEAVNRQAKVLDGMLLSDVEDDILKIVVVNRYRCAPPAVAFITGFGLKSGALASCIAHDSHNIIAVGVSDEEICAAVNAIIEAKGGIALSQEGEIQILPLPIAGIMSGEDGYSVAKDYSHIDSKAKELGTTLKAPFMTLSFMALLVIPSLKLSDQGLFNGDNFTFTPLSTS